MKIKCKLCNERESICKNLCGRCYTKAWRKNNPEKVKLNNKKRYKDNIETYRAYRKNNPERIKRLNKLHYDNNKEKNKLYHKNYKIKYPEKIKIIEKNYFLRNPGIMEKLHDKRYFDGMRIKALERDNFTCQICGMTEEEHLKKWDCSLIVHHKDGNGRDMKNPNNKLSNLQTLCKIHHGKEHGRPIKKDSFE